MFKEVKQRSLPRVARRRRVWLREVYHFIYGMSRSSKFWVPNLELFTILMRIQ